MGRYIALAIFAVLVVFLGVGLTLNPREVPSPLVGKPAPTFSLPTVHDPSQVLSTRELSREVSLLNVWASWCVSCREEHPLLVELSRRGAVAVYGLNYKDERDDAKRWLTALGNPYRASAFDADGRVGIDWGVYGVPETFVIDRKGVIRYKHIGPVTAEAWERTLRPLVEQLQAEARE
jgi:cytochrome c biogenesis protein CcmG/thiol:disulfide interchange protein DsbE